MGKALVRGLKSIVLTSKNPEATARFYIDVFSIPLEKEKHPGAPEHWACHFGGLHVAIHHSDGFWLREGGVPSDTAGSTFLAFTIEDLEAFLEHLKSQNVPVIARQDIGPMKFVSVRDPDGRQVGCGTPWPGT
jgi:catechol 2,3-dioxygenase-like lactoylglutathione lyase family enzyme